MSMNYYAVNDYGMILDNETIEMICRSLYGEDYENENGYELYDEGICEYISEFTGEATPITENGTDDYRKNSEAYNGDTIFYVMLYWQPTLFQAAYYGIDDIVDELKHKLGEYLPDDYDYRSKIRHIVGTYYG